MVTFSLDVGAKILATAGLSFLGLGTQPPTADWGSMLATGRQFVILSPHVVLLPGLALISVGLLWFSQISADGSFVADVLGPSVICAVGAGLVFVPVTIAAVAGVEERESGLASGLINTSQQIGGAIGLANAFLG